MTNTPKVEVLLATRNSQAYLGELLDSLANQTWSDFNLIVSDDASTDETTTVIDRRAQQFREPLRLTVHESPTGSARANFASLLSKAQGDYIFLADHDDVWMPEKIERGLKSIMSLESQYAPETPCIVHGDMTVIGSRGEPITPSFWAFKSIHPEYGQRLRTALMHPTVTGCTVVMNRPLLQLVREVPPSAVMHDWWIGLVAAAFGVVGFDDQPHIKYRIHGANVSNPKKSSLAGAVRRRASPSDIHHWIGLRMDQGVAFLDAYREQLPAESLRTLENFASVRDAGPWARRRILWQGGFRSPDVWRNAATLALI